MPGQPARGSTVTPTPDEAGKLRALAHQAFKGFSDAEVVLIVLGFNSGARFRSDLLGAGLAEATTAAAVDLICHELRSREIDPGTMLGRLMERLLDQMPKDSVPSE